MKSAPGGTAPVLPAASTRHIVAWGLWDWESAAFHAVILTFVFSVYLTDDVGRGLPGTTSAATWFSLSIGIAGVFIAFFAPVTGQRADEGGHRKRSVTLWTLFVIVAMTALFLVKNEPAYFWLGCALLGVASIGSSFADVSYHAMLRQVSTPSTIGRVSGFGWSMGYLGGIVLLLVCYYGFVAAPSGGTAGLLHIATDGGLNFRLVAVFAAAWYLVFATPLMVSVPEMPSPAQPHRVGLLASYRLLIADLRTLWHTDRNAVYFLLSSALFRDGLAGGLSDRQFGLAVAHVEPHSLRAGPVEGLTHRRLPAGGEVECLEVRGEDPAATPDVGSPERQVIGQSPPIEEPMTTLSTASGDPPTSSTTQGWTSSTRKRSYAGPRMR